MSTLPRPLAALALAGLPLLASCVDRPTRYLLYTELILPAAAQEGIDGPVALQLAWLGEVETLDVLCEVPERTLAWSWESTRVVDGPVTDPLVEVSLVALPGDCAAAPTPDAPVLAGARARVFTDVEPHPFAGAHERVAEDEVRMVLALPEPS